MIPRLASALLDLTVLDRSRCLRRRSAPSGDGRSPGSCRRRRSCRRRPAERPIDRHGQRLRLPGIGPEHDHVPDHFLMPEQLGHARRRARCRSRRRSRPRPVRPTGRRRRRPLDELELPDIARSVACVASMPRSRSRARSCSWLVMDSRSTRSRMIDCRSAFMPDRHQSSCPGSAEPALETRPSMTRIFIHHMHIAMQYRRAKLLTCDSSPV